MQNVQCLAWFFGFLTLHSPFCTCSGAHGRICTDTLRVLSAPSLHWTTWAKWCRVREFHPQPLRSERSASGSWANAAKWHSRQESHLQPGGSKPPARLNAERRVQSAESGNAVPDRSAFSTLHSSLECGADGETRTPVGRIARQFTKLLLSLLSHAGLRNAECGVRSAELARAVVTTLVLLIPHSALRTPHLRMVGRHGAAPCSVPIQNRDCIAAMLATQSRHEGGIEPPSRFRIGMKSWPAPVFASREMAEHQGIAPCIPVWKVLADGHQRVSLNTYAR